MCITGDRPAVEDVHILIYGKVIDGRARAGLWDHEPRRSCQSRLASEPRGCVGN